MTTITSVIIFILGTAFGSFFSVVINRLRKKQKIVFGRSICPSCKKKIKWQHLVPVLSWIFLKGKCAYCGKKIGLHYFALEIITGIVFLITFLKWNFIIQTPLIINPDLINYSINWILFERFIFNIIIISFLILIFFYDLMFKEIPDEFSIPLIAISIAFILIFKTTSIESALIGAAVLLTFFLLQFLISRGNWIGGGDLRFAVFMGILLGWEKGLLALILSYLLGGVFSIYLLLKGKVTRKTAIPFGPFLVSGTLIGMFYGQQILDWYFSTLFF